MDAGRRSWYVAWSGQELEPLQRDAAHAEEQQPVTEPADLGLSVGAVVIANRQVDEPEVQARGAEQEIEVSEGIEVAEVRAARLDALVVPLEEHLGAAERVGDPLAEEPGERHSEELVPEEVQEAHRLAFHRVDQARAVDEIALPAD